LSSKGIVARSRVATRPRLSLGEPELNKVVLGLLTVLGLSFEANIR